MFTLFLLFFLHTFLSCLRTGEFGGRQLWTPHIKFLLQTLPLPDLGRTSRSPTLKPPTPVCLQCSWRVAVGSMLGPLKCLLSRKQTAPALETRRAGEAQKLCAVQMISMKCQCSSFWGVYSSETSAVHIWGWFQRELCVYPLTTVFQAGEGEQLIHWAFHSPGMLVVWKQTGGFGCHLSRQLKKGIGRKATVCTFMVFLWCQRLNSGPHIPYISPLPVPYLHLCYPDGHWLQLVLLSLKHAGFTAQRWPCILSSTHCVWSSHHPSLAHMKYDIPMSRW